MRHLLFLALACYACTFPREVSSPVPELERALPTEAAWITAPTDSVHAPNTWLRFQKFVTPPALPAAVPVRIAADSKYWLWVNDLLVVREGGLKWGPTPHGFYYDSLDLRPYLEANAPNRIEVAVWYFGRDGFSHKNHGIAGLWFDAPLLGIASDATWRAAVDTRFEPSSPPGPNYRLPEGNIRFNAAAGGSFRDFPGRMEAARPLAADSLRGEPRPIPQWKDFGRQPYADAPALPFVSTGDTVVVALPYNAQITPYFRIDAATAGQKIDVRTDNYRGGGPPNVRTEYLTRPGAQDFETPGWMNGHRVRYHVPAGVRVLDLGFRETGYATEFAGDFASSDPFFNRLWEKSRRTLYITLRDSYMDCPDRERAQWWGDVVLEMGETFYALDRTSDRLSRKAIRELLRWQRADSTIYSPVPAGNWHGELPTQMLASVGHYGVWHYFWNTGDTALVREVYPHIRDYLALWQTDAAGLVVPRKGGWTWGDWGDHKDLPLIFNGWYHLALRGFRDLSALLGERAAAHTAQQRMDRLATSFHQRFWNGTAYRSPDHTGATDDRAQALAVLTGIAPKGVYPQIREVLRHEEHASPYFEKYILEALFEMGYAEDALGRMKKRYARMVESDLTTLWEGWAVGSATWGGGTYNHAWSGGPLTLLSGRVVGVRPVAAGWRRVEIRPQLGGLERAAATIATPLGALRVRVERIDGRTVVDYEAPEGMEVVTD